MQARRAATTYFFARQLACFSISKYAFLPSIKQCLKITQKVSFFRQAVLRESSTLENLVLEIYAEELNFFGGKFKFLNTFSNAIKVFLYLIVRFLLSAPLIVKP